MSFQCVMFFTFGFTHVVHGFIEQFDDMETVEGDLGVGKSVLDTRQ
jgi:hypothetical protein